jgi:hypothetical protein
MRDAISETYRLSNINLTPVWTGMGRHILKLDTVTEIGKRFLRFSQCKQEMEGYNLNKSYPIATILQVSPLAELNRETLSATVSIPRINTTSDLQNIQRLPYFRLIVCLGIVSDMMYNPDGVVHKYQPVNDELNGKKQSVLSDWHSTNDILPAHVLSVQIDEYAIPLLTDDMTVLLSMGIEFGDVGFGGVIEPVKHMGAGRFCFAVKTFRVQCSAFRVPGLKGFCCKSISRTPTSDLEFYTGLSRSGRATSVECRPPTWCWLQKT